METQTQEKTMEEAIVPTNSVTLTRGQKGTYAWEIKLRWPMGSPDKDVLDGLRGLDRALRNEYPTAEVA